MNLLQFNSLSLAEQKQHLFNCCGSSNWVNCMLKKIPFHSLQQMVLEAGNCWAVCKEEDFLEAFSHHPKIGDIESLQKKFANTAQWAGNEQSGTATAPMQVLEALAKGNNDYENKFGFIFIVCATGKPAQEMLDILQSRLPNSRATELKNAAAEQQKITQLRLQKLLS